MAARTALGQMVAAAKRPPWARAVWGVNPSAQGV